MENFIIVTKLVCIFSTFEDGFKIGKFHCEKNFDSSGKNKCLDAQGNIVITGYNVPETRFIKYDMLVEPTYNSQYGWQAKLIKVKDHLEYSEEGVLRYLINGPLPGIGPKIAKRIYQEFGKDTIEVINSHPEELLKIKGLNERKIYEIAKARKENSGLGNVMEALMPDGFSASQCKKIFDRFGEVSVSLAKTDPWRFCEISGIGFVFIDELARKNNCDMNRQSRIVAGLNYTLLLNEQKGNLGEDNRFMLSDMRHILGNIDKNLALKTADLMRKNHEIKFTNFNHMGLIYRRAAFDAEMTVAKQVIDVGSTFYERKRDKVYSLIKKYEAEHNVLFSDTQKEAVCVAYENSLSIITGGPGTGKTTVEKLIISVLKEINKKENGKEMTFCLLAPTGKAAKRMSESTGMCATTVDSKLQIYQQDNEISDIQAGIEEDCVIVDEASMLDVYKASCIFKSLSEKQRLILIGDIDQLPSVGPGRVLGDLIDSGVPCVRLDCVYRQQGEAGQLIAENANMINKGESLIKYGKGFQFIKYNDDQKMADELAQAYVAACQKYGVEETVCLLPTKKTPYIGVFDMNKRIQGDVNPASPEKKEITVFNTIFRQGDIVMNLKNNQEKGVVNGDIGIVTDTRTEENIKVVMVNFQGNEVTYKGTEELKTLTLAYALTIHKSQGSEYKCVLIGISASTPKSMQKRNLIYTAITRAKKEVYLFGSVKAFENCIHTEDTNTRLTSLSHMVDWYLKQINPFENAQTS